MTDLQRTKPLMYVCHGDDGGPKLHPCRRAQEAMRAAGIDYDTKIAAQGSPLPFLRRNREEMQAELGTTKLPALQLPDGTVLQHFKAIRAWIAEQS